MSRYADTPSGLVRLHDTYDFDTASVREGYLEILATADDLPPALRDLVEGRLIVPRLRERPRVLRFLLIAVVLTTVVLIAEACRAIRGYWAYLFGRGV